MNPFALVRRDRRSLLVAFTIFLTLVCVFGATGCNKLKARDQSAGAIVSA